MGHCLGDLLPSVSFSDFKHIVARDCNLENQIRQSGGSGIIFGTPDPVIFAGFVN